MKKRDIRFASIPPKKHESAQRERRANHSHNHRMLRRSI